MKKNRNVILFILSAVVLAVLPPFLNAYWVDVLNAIGVYAILGLSLNLIVGHAGLFNLGHAAFFAVGAYTAAILNTTFGIPILWLLPVSALAAGLFAAVVARPIVHLRGDYLCIVTIGVGEIVRIALVNAVFGITGGANVIFGISRPSVFDFLENSRFGRALNYLREDEVAAEGSGIPTARYKLGVFALGAAWAGMVGLIFASKMTIIAPESFSFWESVLMFTLIILGGAGSIPGVLLGAALIVGIPEVFRDLANARMLVFGAAMVAMMIFRTEGIIPQRPRVYRLEGMSGEERS
jgi:branched-chain amino acid transport system permease protein